MFSVEWEALSFRTGMPNLLDNLVQPRSVSFSCSRQRGG